MFQTSLNHFLQSFASDWLTAFMRCVTALGYVDFFMVFLIIVLLAINLKKGFILFMVLLWTALITFIGKDYFDLPRPFHVDNTLQFLDGQLPDDTDFTFTERGAVGFWELLPADVLKVTRASDGVENGFPSGHTSIAIAFWGALMMLFRKKWIQILSVLLMILIPLSRIYLGVHFLADVLGGIVVGGFILGVFYAILLRRDKRAAFLAKDHYDIGLNKHSVTLIIAPLPFLWILPSKVVVIVAAMIALGLGFLLLSRRGIPSDEGKAGPRIGRLLLGISAAGLVGFIIKSIADIGGLTEHPMTDFITLFVFFITLIWIGVEIGVRLGMFKRKGLS